MTSLIHLLALDSVYPSRGSDFQLTQAVNKLQGFREIFIFQFINSELRPGKDSQD